MVNVDTVVHWVIFCVHQFHCYQSSYVLFLYAFLVFFCISMVMVVELFWYDLLIKYTNLPDLKMKILFYLLNNGGLIAIALPIMSKMFGKWAIEINLDLCGAYSVNVIKIYYSISIVANCVWLLSFTFNREAKT